MGNNFIDNRPQELCKMCGRCCRCSTTFNTYEELIKLKEEGDEGAKDFLEIFEPFDSIEEARKQDEKLVDNIIEKIKTDNLLDPEKITFYKCKYIKENNLCGIYEERKELCRRSPSSAWAIVPPGCGFEDWLAEKREEIKQKVIKQKENLVIAQGLLQEAVTQQQKERIQITIKNIQETINSFTKYGAKDW